MIETATRMDAPSRSRERISRYATAAKVAAAIPVAMLAANADATIYSQTGLSVTVGSSQTAAQAIQITGAGGVLVGELEVQRRTVAFGGNPARSFASVFINGPAGSATFRYLAQAQNGVGAWSGGLPVYANATWNNPGRTPAQFAGTNNAIGTGATGIIAFGTSNAPSGINRDPQGVGNTGRTWYLLFKFKGGAAIGNYGWISFTANVNGFGNSSLTFTGWGWDDSGATIGAGVTASAVPGGTGLAALAFGAAGLRGRRRSRVA